MIGCVTYPALMAGALLALLVGGTWGVVILIATDGLILIALAWNAYRTERDPTNIEYWRRKLP